MGLYSNLSEGIRACYATVPGISGKFPMMKRILKHVFTCNYFDSKTRYYSLSILTSRKHQTHFMSSSLSLYLPIHLHTSHMFHHTVGFRALDFDMLAIIWQCAQLAHLHCHGIVATCTGNAPPSWNDNTQSHLLVPCGNDIIFATLASRTKCSNVKGSPRPQACAPQWCWSCNACDVISANRT